MARNRLVKEEDTRKAAEAIFVAQVCGALLLLPPLLNLFNIRTLVFGIPLEVLYLFAVWLLLIGCAVVISAVMPRPSAKPQSGEGTPTAASEAEGDGG